MEAEGMEHHKEEVVFLPGQLEEISRQRKEKCDGRKCLVDGETPSNSLLFCFFPSSPHARKQDARERYSASPLAAVDAHTQRQTSDKQDGDAAARRPGLHRFTFTVNSLADLPKTLAV